MHINAFVLVAQLVNFLLLMFLLKRLLYDRIAAAMDARTAEIAAQRAQAETMQAQAAAASADCARRQEQLAGEREAVLAQARAAAEQQRQALLQQARDEAAASRRQWQDGLRREQDEFVRAFRQRAARQVCAAAGRALADLADAGIERLMAVAFLRRLTGLDEARRRQLAATTGPVVMRSAFPFPDDLRADCARDWRTVLGREPELRYETLPALVAGLEARLAGQTLAWNIDHYLDGLADDLAAAFRDKAGAA